jgi:hypothetical protein
MFQAFKRGLLHFHNDIDSRIITTSTIGCLTGVPLGIAVNIKTKETCPITNIGTVVLTIFGCTTAGFIVGLTYPLPIVIGGAGIISYGFNKNR